MKLRPLFDKVVLKREEAQETTKAGIILPDSAKETILVLDATTGQNAVMQAREFKEAAHLTGLILTKLDGTAKGGIILSIKKELGIPVKFIGVGEQIDDMKHFDADEFASALFEGGDNDADQ